MLGEGTFLEYLAFVERFAPEPVTAEIARRARVDEARHVAFGVEHARHYLGADPDRVTELVEAVRRRADYLATPAPRAHTSRKPSWSWPPATPSRIREGVTRLRELQASMHAGGWRGSSSSVSRARWPRRCRSSTRPISCDRRSASQRRGRMGPWPRPSQTPEDDEARRETVAATRREKRSLAAVVLAAGKGERLRSDTPKVLHSVAGRPLVWHTLQAIRAAKPDRIVVVVGHGADDVRGAVASVGIEPAPVFVEQDEQLGTGHAVQLAEKAVGRTDDVLVANGDFDPITPTDVRELISSHRRSDAAVTVGSTILERPGGYGRVVREASRVVDVVEGRDASIAIRRIHEVATNWIAFRRDLLYATLLLLDRDNRQREYYLNRAISILLEKGERVDAVACDTSGLLGANTRAGLAALEGLIRRRVLDEHMAKGVGYRSGNHVRRRGGRDRARHRAPAQHVPRGRHEDRCGLRHRAFGRDRPLPGRDRSVVSFAVVEDSRIGRDCEVGPFAGSEPARCSRTPPRSNFVEVKKSRVGKGSKAKHLAYLGDADLGARVNVGAGTVTVNYDGYEKHRTVVGTRRGSGPIRCWWRRSKSARAR